MKSKVSLSAPSRTLQRLPPDIQRKLQHTVKAATLMEVEEAKERVTETASLIFEHIHEPVVVAALRLDEARKAFDKLENEVSTLKDERKRLPPTVYDPDASTQENSSDER